MQDIAIDLYSKFNVSSRTSGNFTKRCRDDVDGRSSTTEECDSTTEPKPHFQLEDDVYYQDDTGKFILGTVAQIQGKKFKIVFMDETEKWAPLSRLKGISNQLPDDENDRLNNKSVTPPPQGPSSATNDVSVAAVSSNGSKKKSKCDLNGQVKEHIQITCGSCGTQKTITAKKASEFSPFTSHQYNCRKCINKSKTNKNNGVPIIPAHYLTGRGRPKNSETNGAMAHTKGLMDNAMGKAVYRAEVNVCLHCRCTISEKVSLHCTMCERPCHPSCLALTPPPLPGDIFWSIICQVCGTQKPDGAPENDSQKLYSSRRSISCWSDVAYLLLSCLGCKFPNENFFNLDEEVIPFWEENVERLHLPRQYKSTEPTERRKLLLLALSNASLRFIREERRKSTLWGIKDHHRSYNNTQVIKPPTVSGGRAVTAAGFPVSIRTSNPEAASVAMSNIAQTIAVQAAANKANSQGVPTPKNSPSHISPKSSSQKSMGASGGIVSSTSRKSSSKVSDQPRAVARKTGSELNSGTHASRKNLDTWASLQTNSHGFTSQSTETLPSVTQNQQQSINSNAASRGQQSQPQQPSIQKHVLTPSPGGAARVTGVVLTTTSTSSTSSLDVTNCRFNPSAGSYPVRKNGSPVLNKSIKVETVEGKKDTERTASYRFEAGSTKKSAEDLVRESPGFKGQVSPKVSLKRKMSPVKADGISITPSQSGDASGTKKVKVSLPSSTDITSKRLLSSPPKDSPSVTSPDPASKGQKKAMSPLQKLSDLQRNGGLTVACLTQTESGLQTVAVNPSTLGHAVETQSNSEFGRKATGAIRNFSDALTLSPDRSGQMFSSPTKNSHGASTSTATAVKELFQDNSLDASVEAQDNTKDRVSSGSLNVTNASPPPRAFKLASLTPPGTSKALKPAIERRMTRPVRMKRLAASSAAEKQSLPGISSAIKAGSKKLNNKTTSATTAAAAALVHKASRGRPKKFKPLLRRPNGSMVGIGFNIGQFNGPAVNSAETSSDGSSANKINEAEFTFKGSIIQDLLDYGHGYRLECLPRAPDSKKELEQTAKKYLADELAPRPPTYWSTTSNLSHSMKKSINRKSRRDLKDLDSYYISGRKIDQNGIQYQVIWKDGRGFECTSDDEEELGLDFGINYLNFEDYNHAEYFFDEMPVISDSSPASTSDANIEKNGDCDNKIVVPSLGDCDHVARPINGKVSLSSVLENGSNDMNYTPVKQKKIKKEPEEKETKPSSSAAGGVSRNLTDGVSFSNVKPSSNKRVEPVCIDLTDSP